VIVVDTSVAVAAALPWHEAHTAARSALPRERTVLLAQVAVETYSVLTRLPPPQRVPVTVARDYLFASFALPPLILSQDGYRELIDLAAGEAIGGGAVYDALIGATAKEADAMLLTLDRRALGTYRLVGVDYRLIT